MLIVCCFAVAIAGDVTHSKKIKGALSIEQLNAETPKRVESSINNEVDKEAYYNALHEEHRLNFDGPTLWNEIEVAPQNGSRDGNVSVDVCSLDSWSSEIYYILLDTQNWWAWGSDGWVNHSAGAGACENFSVSVPAGNYMFILGDSYGDGGGTADVSVNGELVGSVATASGDAYSEYSYLYEAPFVFDLTDAPVTDATVTFDIDGVDDCGFVSVTGTFDDWSGWGANTDTGMSATIAAGDHEFVILCTNTEGEWWNDIWANSTVINAPIDGACWNGNYDYANYTLSVGADDMTVSYCAGTCDAECASGCEGNEVSLVVGGGSWDSEISWDMSDGSSGAAGSFDLCMPDGSYTFNGYDSYGDGWNGGSATMTDAAGNTIFSFQAEGAGGSIDFDLPYSEPPPPPSCDYSTFVLTMNDAYGDGWNGNTFCVNDDCAGLDSGATGTAEFCIDMSVANTVVCDGGSWQSEVSWSLADADGNEALAGGAPFIGCFGTCDDADVYGCMDMNSSNYNADATVEDGSCASYPGAFVYPYWNDDPYFEYFVFGCGSYVWTDSDLDGMPDAAGDGACTYFGDYNGDGLEDGLACEAFGCDGGDCEDCVGDCLGADIGDECWDGSFECDEADCPDSCDSPATFNMYDSWGDGWNGATFTMTAEDGTVVGEGTLASGSYGFETLCLPDGTYGLVVGGGSYDSEISWDIANADGDVIAGGLAGEHTVVIGAPPVEVPPAPSDLSVSGDYDMELGPVLNMTWSPVETADSYGIYIWDDTPDEICDDGIDNDEDGYTDCADFDCSDLEECQENCSDGIDNDGDGYTDCFDFDCGGTDDCPCAGNYGWIGDGYCDGSNNNADCGFDGGDCCPGDCVDSDSYDCATFGGDCDDCVDPDSGDLAEGGECYDDGGYACAEGELLVSMADAYGDGWNGNVLTIGDASFTIDSGSSDWGCYAGAMDVAVTCDGGSWQSEVSWTISNEAGEELLAGGAPFDGCLGTCDDGGGDDACGDCMAYCVSYVMENYGYSEEDATYWCSTTPDSQYGCADSCNDGGGDECTDNAITVNMYDSYGDGWDAGSICIGSDCYTLSSGSAGNVDMCLADGSYDVVCGGSNWASEMSFDITDAAGNVLLAGAAGAYVLDLGAGDLVSNGPEESKGPKMGTIEHKLSLANKTVGLASEMNQYNRINDGSSNDREGWILLGYTAHYSEIPADDLTIYGFGYDQTELLGVSSVNIAGESDIASASGTTPGLAAPYNLQASDDNGDGTVSLTWEYDGFAPVPYPECTGTVSWIGDGWCDSSNNNADCGYDGGDCCAGSCDGSDDLYSCDECDADGDGVGCGDQADADGDGLWDSCCDPAEGGECAEPEPCTSLNPVVLPYDGDENGCYNFTNAFTFTFEEGCGVTGIAYGTDPGDLAELTGGPFYGSFIFHGFGPSETYFFQLSTADGIESGIFEGTTSDFDCAGDVPEPTACEEAGGIESYIADGWCDASNNNEDCGYDGGDCCPCTCESTTYDCGSYGGDCDDCIDPAAEGCPDDCNDDDGGEGGDAILSYTLTSGSEGSTTFTVPEGCASQSLTVDGGSWQSEVSWDINGGEVTGGAPYSGSLALAAGDHTFNAADAYGDGWNGNVATMTCDDAGDGVGSGNYKSYKYIPHAVSNGSGLHVTEVVDIVKPIVIEQNVDRLVTSFNVYDENGAAGTAFDLLFSVASDGGCWTVTAYDADLDVESGASNEACFDGCATEGSGDANGDGELNVLDVVVIVGEVLEPSWEAGSCELATADANGDGELNVLDVVIIVGNILDGRTVDADSATIYKADGGVTIDANGFVAGVEMKISHDENFALNLTDNAMVADYVTKGNTTHLIVVAPESEVIFTSTGDFTIDEVIAANTNGEYISLDNGMPSEFSLSSAYPNPFNPVTNMKLSLVNASNVSMNVYNVSGQLVDVLVDGALDAGYHNITWDASSVSSGVYFVKVISGSNVSVQKLMLLK